MQFQLLRYEHTSESQFSLDALFRKRKWYIQDNIARDRKHENIKENAVPLMPNFFVKKNPIKQFITLPKNIEYIGKLTLLNANIACAYSVWIDINIIANIRGKIIPAVFR